MTKSTANLVRAAATGDRLAFELLVSQNAAMVTGIAFSRCGDFGLPLSLRPAMVLRSFHHAHYAFTRLKLFSFR